jgi:DNA-3-methyladenine glycosylase
VLIRAAEPEDGIELMAGRSGTTPRRLLMSGPGRLCRAFGLTTKQSGMDVCGRALFFEDRGEIDVKILRTSRIGIRKGTDRLWRFCDSDSDAVSARTTAPRARK